MTRNKTNHEDTINLLDIFKYLRKYYKLIILTSVIGLVVGIVLSIASFMRGEMSKQYVIRTSIAVTSQTEDGLFTSHSVNPDSADIHLAEDMVDSVIFVIRSDRTLEKAVDELQLIGISIKDIYDNLHLSQYNDTQIIDLSLYWRNAEEGKKILEAINKVSPKILRDILKIGDVRVVNDPKAKYLIGGSIKASTWVMMTVFGMLAGIGIAILMMLLRPTLVNSGDAEGKLGLTVLGEIPKDKRYPSKGTLLQEQVLTSTVRDSYVSATHILKQAMDKQQCRVIYLTSADKTEGKTSVTSNIGLQLAGLEKRTLLIDMDLENPNLSNRFIDEVSYDHSLNAVYQGDVDIAEAIVPVNGFLHILPLIHDEKEILLNETMMSMIRKISENYDYVLIDTTAVGTSADILSINQIADAALFVIRYDHTPISVIDTALIRLDKTEIPILGCVINQS